MIQGYEINISQNQKVVMTPELRQAINILQLPIAELNYFIEQQLLENPLLQITEEKKDDVIRKDEVDWSEYFNEGRELRIPKEKKEEISFEKFITKENTLIEYLEGQLRLSNLSEEDFKIAKYIIGELDERGYLLYPLKGIADELDISLEKVEEILLLIQDLEPKGVGARSLAECLEIQLRKKGKLTDEIKVFINNYLLEVGRGNLKRIAKNLGISLKSVQEMVDIIRTLNPKPGAAYGAMNENKFIRPDVIIKKVGKEYFVLVNDKEVPSLTINKLYKQVLVKGSRDKETESYIIRNCNKAVGLIKSIEQRRITLFKVVSNLVEQQRDFLEKGTKYLTPLTLKDVANGVNVHESTVSRVVANKYVQTPQGLYELKYFFSKGMQNEKGKNISSRSIKKAIAEIIDKEDPKKPFSDNKISEILLKKGLKIARRTVAKYREELGILSSKQRKRY